MVYLERRKIEVNRSVTASVMRVFVTHVRRYPWVTVIVVSATTLVGILNVVVPIYYKRFFDLLASSNGEHVSALVPPLLTVLFTVIGFKTIAWAGRRMNAAASIFFQTRIMRDLTETSFRNLLGHSYRFFADNFAGSLVRKVNRLARAFEDIADQVEYNLLPLVVTLSGILVVLFRRQPLLGAILLAGVLVFIALHLAIARWKQKYDLRRSEKDSEATGVISDALTNAVTIKSFARERYEETRYQKVIEELKRLRIVAWALNEGVDAIQGGMMVVIELAMFWSAVILWQRGVLGVGDFVLIQVYLMNLFDRLWEFGRLLRRIYEGIADAAEMVEILNTSHEIKDKPTAKPIKVSEGKIEFRNVDFAFMETRKVLKNFSLEVSAGEKVALVGVSGAGKTTVAKLLLRFHEVTSGKIFIDGQDISDVTQQSLRENVALVPQEPTLFHRTLKENILYGRMKATEEEVIEASRKAHCHEFITRLPYQYETYVGERGIKLSGGERQRVAIARAILKNAPILILDEATSSLDSQSEALIQDALEKLMQGKTAIVIAHRLSTIMKMDRIVVISKGKVVTAGTHESLIREEGIYRKLWEIQAGGFLR